MLNRREVLRLLRLKYRPGKRFAWGGVVFEATTYPWWCGEYVIEARRVDGFGRLTSKRDTLPLWTEVGRIAAQHDMEV